MYRWTEKDQKRHLESMTANELHTLRKDLLNLVNYTTDKDMKERALNGAHRCGLEIRRRLSERKAS